MYDTETKKWVYDWETEDMHFHDGTIWIPEQEEWVSVANEQTLAQFPKVVATHQEALVALRTTIKDPTLSVSDLPTFTVEFAEIIMHTVKVQASDEDAATEKAYEVVLGDEIHFSSNSLGKDPIPTTITKVEG
jgi:hypothetical protein